MNIPFGMLTAVTGMTAAGTTGAAVVEVEGIGAVGGAIMVEKCLDGVDRLYAYKNNLPGVVHTYMDAVGCIKELY